MENYFDKSRIINNKDIWLAHWVAQSSYHYGQKMWQSGLCYSAGMQIDADVCYVDYPAETSAWYKAHGITMGAPEKKTIDELVAEVYAGKWGCGQQRFDELTAAGYDYYAVQDEINRRMAESAKIAKSDIKVGSKVMVKQGAKTYDGKFLALFVSTRPHIVTELVRDRAVICYGNLVVAAVNIKDLTTV